MTITAIQCRCCGNELEVEGCVIDKIENEARLREAIRKASEMHALMQGGGACACDICEIAREGR